MYVTPTQHLSHPHASTTTIRHHYSQTPTANATSHRSIANRPLNKQPCHTHCPTKTPQPPPQAPFSLKRTNSHNHAFKMAFLITLTVTLLASIFTFSRASHYTNETLSNTTLSTAYGTHQTKTIGASQLAGHKGKDAEGMGCLAPPATFTVPTTANVVALPASTTRTRCANRTITGLPIGPLVVCTPPSTITYAPEPRTSSLLLQNTTSPSPSTPLHNPKSTATSTVEGPSTPPPPPPPPKTVFITVTHTAEPSPSPFRESSADFHLSQPGKQPFRVSETAKPTLAATPTSLDDDGSGTGTATGLPRFTLDPETAASGAVGGEATPAPEPAPPSPLSTAATETEQDKDTAWSGVDGAIPWQLKNPPLARRVSRVWAGMQGISRAGAPHLAPAKAKRGREED